MEETASQFYQPTEAAVPFTEEEAEKASVRELLQNVDPVEPSGAKGDAEKLHQNKLVEVRLGLASALFAALRAKHAPSAAHCMRVALACSAWGVHVQLKEELLDAIEVASLLHDIGKVGVPDHILHSTSKLSPDEYAVIDRHRLSGLEILSACCRSTGVLEIVQYAAARYDGSRPGYSLKGDDLPLGARMVAIADAFDAMTTDHVYRRALSRERALAELFEGAGTQFDPGLVNSFCDLVTHDGLRFDKQMAARWLGDLAKSNANSHWKLTSGVSSKSEDSTNTVFHDNLMNQMTDAVVFVDLAKRILTWNRAAALLTGIPAEAMLGKQWSSQLVGLQERYGNADCPISNTLKTGVNSSARMELSRRDGDPIPVDAQFHLTSSANGVAHGVTVLMRDATNEIDLEERVQTLSDKATRDPLTGVGNRAEFDRALAAFVEKAKQHGKTFSLIMTDIDHFKSVNDTFGHQAGDAALISFASLLTNHHRRGDMVARYGGEEFAVICADCDNATATIRAEAMCNELAGISQPALNGKPMTASFGVTEIQAGDTDETILRRADRALMQAKEMGRNMVVQLGSGGGETIEETAQAGGWFSWLTGGSKAKLPEQLLQRTLITPVPVNIVIEKLRGFVADHHAEITDISEVKIDLKIKGQHSPNTRRIDDRPVPFSIELKFTNAKEQCRDRSGTLIQTVIRPIRHRDRRERNAIERARSIFASLKSYLMASDFVADQPAEED